MAILTLKQAAERLGYSVSGLRKLIRAGRGPRFLRVQPRGHYRFRGADLDEFLERNTVAVSARVDRPELIGPAFQVDRSLLSL